MSTAHLEPGWKVLLIGGCAGVGKTSIARTLAERFRTSMMLTDDIRLALQEMTTPEQQPDLHAFANERQVRKLTAEQTRDRLIAVANAMQPALRTICAYHTFVVDAEPIIIEGENVVPQLAADRRFRGLKTFGDVNAGPNDLRAVFLYEPDEQTLLSMMREHNARFRELPNKEQERMAKANWLYGLWLKEEAERVKLPVVTVRPWTTLLERVLGSH